MTYVSQVPRPASEKQLAFLRKLLDERIGFSEGFETRVREALAGERPMDIHQASKTISWLMEKERKPKAAPPALDFGLYANAKGQVYKVYKTRNGRRAVKRLDVVLTDHGSNGRFVYEPGAYGRLAHAVEAGEYHTLTADEARAFGRLYSMCVNCLASLTDDRSIAAGYGPTCAANHGWHYPSVEEAAEILAMPTEVEPAPGVNLSLRQAIREGLVTYTGD